MTEEQQRQVQAYLAGYKERADILEKEGKIRAAWYIACLHGMWAHTLKAPEKPNPYEGNQASADLYRWFLMGYETSEFAISWNQKSAERKKQAAKRKAEIQKKVIEKKSGIFSMKLW